MQTYSSLWISFPWEPTVLFYEPHSSFIPKKCSKYVYIKVLKIISQVYAKLIYAKFNLCHLWFSKLDFNFISQNISAQVCRFLQTSICSGGEVPVCTDFQELPSGTHLEAIICRCHSVSRCIRAGQQHFITLEQLGGMENKCVLLSFVSYKTP